MNVKNLIKFAYLKRTISLIVLVCFSVTSLNIQPVQALEYNLPKPGTMVSLSPWFNPPILKGIKVHTDNPFKFDFILDKGDSDLSDYELKKESSKLIKYFLASLTIPEKDLWVNLSPYEKDRIIPENFGDTQMGEQLLAQDYLLKQVTASVLYPEGEIGKEFWRKVYAAAYAKYGTHNIPVKTFNKVWIMPGKAVVYENSVNNSVMIVQSSLKVMLEEDYLALNKDNKNVAPQGSNAVGSQIVREIIIPQITKEVNEGKNFAALRQVYNSLILASWYKNKLKHSLLNKGFSDRSKVSGVDVKDKDTSEEIYQQYLKSFRKGVYNYIKEEQDPVTNETTPRKYFSGGVSWGSIDKAMNTVSGTDAAKSTFDKFKSLKMLVLTVGFAASLALAAPAAKAQTMTIGQPAGQPTVTTTVVKGDTASEIVVKSFQSMTGKKIGWGSFLKLEKGGAITLQNNGVDIKNPDWKKMRPGNTIKVKVNLTLFAAHSAAPPVGHPRVSPAHNFIAPVALSSVRAPSGVAPLVSASPVLTAPAAASPVPVSLNSEVSVSALNNFVNSVPGTVTGAESSAAPFDFMTFIAASEAGGGGPPSGGGSPPSDEVAAYGAVPGALSTPPLSAPSGIPAAAPVPLPSNASATPVNRINAELAQRDTDDTQNMQAAAVLQDQLMQERQTLNDMVSNVSKAGVNQVSKADLEKLEQQSVEMQQSIQVMSSSIRKLLKQNPQITNRQEILTMSVKIEKMGVDALAGTIKGVHLAPQFGGNMGPAFKIGVNTYGLISAKIVGNFNVASASAEMLSDMLQLIQESKIKRLNEYGGVVTVKGIPFSPGPNKENVRLFSTVNPDTGKVEHFAPESIFNFVTIDQAVSQLLQPIFNGHRPRNFSGTVFYSLQQKAAHFEWMTNTDSNLKYWIERKGHTQNIYRHNLKTDKWELLSTADMYYAKADKKTNGFETESFLRYTYGWMEKDGWLPVDSIADLEVAAAKLNSVKEHGNGINPYTQTTQVYERYEDIPTGFPAGPMPKFDDKTHMFQTGADGHLEMTAKPGVVAEPTFFDAHLGQFWQVAVDNGYIDAQGTVQEDKFSELKTYADMVLPGASDEQKKQVYDIMQQALRPAMIDPRTGNIVSVGLMDAKMLYAFYHGGAGQNGVPWMIVHTFRDQAPYQVLINDRSDAVSVPTYTLKHDEKIIIDSGIQGVGPIVLKEGTTVTWAQPFAAERTMADGSKKIVPAVVEFAKDLQQPQDYYAAVVDLKTGEISYLQGPPEGKLLTQDRADVFGQADFNKYVEPSPTVSKEQAPPTLQKGLEAIGIKDTTKKSKDQILAELDKINSQVNIQPGQKEAVQELRDFINVYAHTGQDALNPSSHGQRQELIPGNALYLGLPLPSDLSHKLEVFYNANWYFGKLQNNAGIIVPILNIRTGAKRPQFIDEHGRMKGISVLNPMPAEYSQGFPQAADSNTITMTAIMQPQRDNENKVTLTEQGRLFVPGPGSIKARMAALDAFKDGQSLLSEAGKPPGNISTEDLERAFLSGKVYGFETKAGKYFEIRDFDNIQQGIVEMSPEAVKAVGALSRKYFLVPGQEMAEDGHNGAQTRLMTEAEVAKAVADGTIEIEPPQGNMKDYRLKVKGNTTFAYVQIPDSVLTDNRDFLTTDTSDIVARVMAPDTHNPDPTQWKLSTPLTKQQVGLLLASSRSPEGFGLNGMHLEREVMTINGQKVDTWWVKEPGKERVAVEFAGQYDLQGNLKDKNNPGVGFRALQDLTKNLFAVPMANGTIYIMADDVMSGLHSGEIKFKEVSTGEKLHLQTKGGQDIGWPNDKYDYELKYNGQNIKTLFSAPNSMGGVDFKARQEILSEILRPTGKYSFKYDIDPNTGKVVFKNGQPVMILTSRLGPIGWPEGFQGFPEIARKFVVLEKDDKGQEKSRTFIEPDELNNYAGNRNISIIRLDGKGNVVAYVNLNPDTGVPYVDVANVQGGFNTYGIDVVTGQYKDSIGYVTKGPVLKAKDEKNRPMDITVYERHLSNGAFESAIGIVTHSGNINAIGLDAGKGQQYVEFYPQKFENGKPVSGLAIVGPSDSKTPRQIYELGPNYEIQWGNILGEASSNNGLSLGSDIIQKLNISGHIVQLAKQHLNENDQDRWFVVDETTKKVVGTIDPVKYGKTDQVRHYVLETSSVDSSFNKETMTYLLRQTGNQALTLERLLFDARETQTLNQDQMLAEAGVLSGKLKKSIDQIKAEIGVQAATPVEFVRSEEKIIGNGTHIFYRVKGDPLARIVVYVNSAVKSEASILVNTSFDEQTPTQSYEVSSLGQVYYIESQGSVKRDDLIGQFNLRNIPGFDADNRQFAFNQFNSFVKIKRYRLIAGLSDESLKDLVLTRYLASGDPLSLDVIKEDRGNVRIMEFQAIETNAINQGLPLNVVSGEVSIEPDLKMVLRETSFVRAVSAPDPVDSYYEYTVNKFFRDGREYGPGWMTIKFYYNTGKVVEEETKLGTKLLSLDEISLQVTRHNDVTGQDQFYSTFTTKAFVKDGHTYRYAEEMIDPQATSGEKPLQSIFRDGKLFATRKNGRINLNPYFTPGVWDRVKYYIFPAMKDSVDVNELFRIASSGHDNDGNAYDVYVAANPVQKQADMPVYQELGHELSTWTLYGAFLGFLGMLTYAYWGGYVRKFLNQFRGASNGNTSSLDSMEGIFGKETASKIVALRSFSGRLPSITRKREGWETVLENYLEGFLAPEEIENIKEAVGDGRFEFREDFQDLSQNLDLKEVSAIRDARDLEDTLKKSGSDIAVALNALNDAGVGYAKQFELLKNMDLTRPSATVWVDIYFASLNIFNTQLKELIITEKYSEAQELSKKIPTPDSRAIFFILDDKIQAQKMRQFFSNEDNKGLSLPMLVERFVRKSTEEITNKILDKYFGKDTLNQPLYQQFYKKEHIDGIVQELYTRFRDYPHIFMNALKDETTRYKIDAVTDLGQPVTVSSFVIYRTQMLPRSALQENTIGAMSVMAPQVLFMSKYLEYLHNDQSPDSVEMVGLNNNFWMNMLHINNWGIGNVPGLLKYITSPAAGGRQIDATLRDIMHEGNIYDLFEYLNHKDIKEAVDIYESLMQVAMSAVNKDKAENGSYSARIMADLRKLKEKTTGIVNEINAINKIKNNKDKEEAVESLYQDKIIALNAPFVAKVNERRKQASPWVEKLDELTKTHRGAFWLYALRIAPFFSRAIFSIMAKQYNVKEASSLRDVYGIRSKGAQWAVRILEYSVMAAGIGGAFLTGYVIWPVLAAGLIMLPRLLFGKVNNPSERGLWVGVFSGFAWVMALFSHQLFGKFSTIVWTSVGFWNTALLIVLLAPVTLLGVYRLATFIKGYVVYVNSIATPTARKRMGLFHLLNPFSLDMVVWKKVVPLLEDRGWMPVWAEKFVLEHMRGFYTAHYMDLLKAEQTVGYLTANRVLIKEYLTGLYTNLYRVGLVTGKELKDQIDFLSNPSSGRYSFVIPADPKAKEYIFTDMMSFAYKRPAASRFAYITASGDHVQSHAELFSHTFERHAAGGSINALGLKETAEKAYAAVVSYNRKHDMNQREALERGMKVANAYFAVHKLRQDVRPEIFLEEAKKVLTPEEFSEVEKVVGEDVKDHQIKEQSLLGYLARTQRNAFDNIIELMKGVINDDDKFNTFKKVLGEIDETTDLIPRFKEAAIAAGLDKDPQKIGRIVELFERFLNESRPNNKGVVENMGETLVEHHLYAASDYGDMRYHKAVLDIANEYSSLPVAYESIGEKVKGGVELSPSEKYFYAGYNNYKATVELKYKPIFQMAQIWTTMTRFVDKDGKIKYRMAILPEYADAFKDKAKFDVIEQEKDGKTSMVVLFGGLTDFADAILKFRNDNYFELLGSKTFDDMKDVIQFAYDIKSCEDNNVYIPFYDAEKDNIIPNNKNGGIGTNLWASYERMSNYDAHVRSYKGQSTQRLLLQSWLSREPQYVVINPAFRIWSSSDDSFAGTSKYKISQETFTNDVLNSLRNLTSFYGKGFILPAAGDSMLGPPGEDSAAFLMFQRSYPNAVSTSVQWMTWEWGRPSLLAESMMGTEMRYTFNVSRFLLDAGQYEVFFNENIGYDVKLHHMALFLHYLSAPLALVLLLTLPALQGFSAFAYLSPLKTFFLYSTLFMEAINIFDFMRHLRTTGSIWRAMFRTARDIQSSFPYYVSMISSFFKGMLYAANDLFSFILSQKEGHLAQQLRQQRFAETRMLTLAENTKSGFARKLIAKGKLPLDGLIGVAGISSWVFSALTNNWIAMFVTLPYLWASISFLTGTNILDVFKDRKGKMKGYSMTAQFGKLWGLPALVFGITTLAFMAQSPGFLLTAGIVGAKAKMLFWSGFVLTGFGLAAFFSHVWQAVGWTVRDFKYFLQDVFSRKKAIPASPASGGLVGQSPAQPSPMPSNVPEATKKDNAMLTQDSYHHLKDMASASFDNSSFTMPPIKNIDWKDRAIVGINNVGRPRGGIDLSKTMLDVESSGDLIQTAFDDPSMLRLLLNSDGLTPIIMNVKAMTPSMLNHYVGLN